MARAGTARGDHRARWRRTAGASPLFWGPSLIVGAVVALPIIYLLIRSVDAGTDAWHLLARLQTLQLLGRTALLGFTVTGACVLISVPLAWLTTRTDIPFRRILSVAAVLPLVVPTYIGGFSVVTILGPRGLLQGVLETPFGIERLPEIFGFPGALLTLTLFSYPYVLLMVRASILGINPDQEEASRTLGHGPWTTFIKVTLPHLKPALAASSLLVTLYVLSDFGAVTLLQFDSFTRVIFVQYQASFDRTLASVLSLVLAGAALVLVLAESRARSRVSHHAQSAPQGSIRHVELGRWRWPMACAAWFVVLVALGLPMSALLYWLAQGLAHGEEISFIGQATVNAMYASLLAAGLALVAAIPVAVLGVRFSGRLARFVEGCSYLGFATPGVVIALSLVFFGANFLTAVYQTLGMLILAYAILFLPLAIGSVRTSLIQVNPEIEDAARSLGRSPLGVVMTVVLPLIRPGIATGAALVFLTTMKELPATLILAPIGFNTLATELWTAAEEGFFARAAVPGIILLIVSAIPVAMLLWQEKRQRA